MIHNPLFSTYDRLLKTITISKILAKTPRKRNIQVKHTCTHVYMHTHTQRGVAVTLHPFTAIA